MALDFILERYNYWIFIVLMMTGLYVVISRGNLVKKLIGLNLFQTSVFIYYISIGKIAGGTAPIIIDGEEGAHGAAGHAGAGADAPAGGLHDTASGAANGIDADALANAGGRGADAPGLHDAPSANPPLARPAPEHVESAMRFEAGGAHHDAAAHAANAIHQATDVIYTNPLPHVLILTAIVVGVATTAVGLALAVRIREAYGTIEEDELEAADDIAEFGHEMAKGI
ncbi:MAG: hypothetical protein GC153_07195 [Alphaproteobacteria bacterium]|nr:hypothetical protein [Alphaproteobacteria bacterium]